MRSICKNHKTKSIKQNIMYSIVALSLLSTTIYSIYNNNTNTAFATSRSTTFSVNAINNISLSLSSNNIILTPSSNNVELDVSPTSGGTFNSVDITATVGTNNASGYNLSIRSSNTNLTRTTSIAGSDDGNGNPITPTIATLPNKVGGYTLAEFNGTSSDSEAVNATLNKWGYSTTTTTYNSNNDSGNGNDSNGTTTTSNFLPFTTSFNTINSKSTNINSDDTIVTIATRMDNTVPSGTYTATLTFIAVANIVDLDCPVNAICYNDNGANSPSTMANQSITVANNTDTTTTTLWASNFRNKAGHGFAGWNTRADGTGQNYGPNETITINNDDIATVGLTLYANWIPSSGTLQGWNGCSSMAVNEVTALTDARDNNTYAIAKLPNTYSTETGQYTDGTCWMIENLRLDNTAELTVSNTNNPLLPLTNDNSTASNYLSVASGDWCQTNSSACDNQSKLNTGNTTNTATTSTNNTTIYGYGNYYNWYSATGGWGEYNTTYYFNSNGELIGTKVGDNPIDGTDEGADPSKTIVTSTNATSMPGDICPAGWRLPMGGSYSTNGGQTINTQNSDFYKLMYALQHNTAPNQMDQWSHHYYDNTTGATQNLRKYPNNFLFSGSWNGTGPTNRGSSGGYWSSTVSAASNACRLSFGSNDVRPGTNGGSKWLGFTVRCVAGS